MVMVNFVSKVKTGKPIVLHIPYLWGTYQRGIILIIYAITQNVSILSIWKQSHRQKITDVLDVLTVEEVIYVRV